MVHRMRLVNFAFEAIKKGEKDIEVRLNDEKRRLIKVGDIIEFQHMETKDILKVQVIHLHKFDTFEELFRHFDYKRLGLNESDDASIMNQFYSKRKQDKYGVVGIEIQLI